MYGRVLQLLLFQGLLNVIEVLSPEVALLYIVTSKRYKLSIQCLSY